jgi:hypothetical protein
MIRTFALVLVVAAAGCGSSGVPTGGGGSAGTGGGGGSEADLAVPVDMAQPPGFCGGVTCTGGKTCCAVGGANPMCMTSCPDGGLSAQCSKPSDCPGATAACCITIANYMPTAVMCSDGPQCMPNISAGGSGKDRACVTSNDCTDNGGGMNLPDCCTSTQSSQHVCFSKALLTSFPQLAQYFTCP